MTLPIILLSVAIIALCISHTVMARELHRQARNINALVWSQMYPEAGAEAARVARQDLERQVREGKR